MDHLAKEEGPARHSASYSGGSWDSSQALKNYDLLEYNHALRRRKVPKVMARERLQRQEKAKRQEEVQRRGLAKIQAGVKRLEALKKLYEIKKQHSLKNRQVLMAMSKKYLTTLAAGNSDEDSGAIDPVQGPENGITYLDITDEEGRAGSEVRDGIASSSDQETQPSSSNTPTSAKAREIEMRKEKINMLREEAGLRVSLSSLQRLLTH